jgi:hypothetical protein
MDGSMVDEGRRIAEAAASSGAPVRLTGGVAIALRCPSAAAQPLRREYADIDVVARRRESRALVGFFAELGYAPDQRFNAVHGARRQLFWNADHTTQIDVFIDRYEMCHTLDLRDRLLLDPATLTLADLLLTKLQVVETNEKDLVDIATLLMDHPLTRDESGINVAHISSLAGSDWGWWRTMTMVADRALKFAEERDVGSGAHDVGAQVRALNASLDAAPKSARWRLRARVGDRAVWYERPEDSH